MFVMISSPFFVIVANAEQEPAVWTNQDHYIYGETVIIQGEHFLPGLLTITLSHPDFAQPIVYENVKVNFDGTFVCSEYKAGTGEIQDPTVPVEVTAYQDPDHQATCLFYDPAIVVQAFQPYDVIHLWGKDNTKGWNEGDSVPMRVKINSTSSQIYVELKIDYLNGDVYGFDYLAQEWFNWMYVPAKDDYVPQPPFNTYPASTSPFYVPPNEGTILSQGYIGTEVSGGVTVSIYHFTLKFAGGGPDGNNATVRFGAHLAVSGGSVKGASWYPGSSLHVAINLEVPALDQGDRDVPFPVKWILTPPSMHIAKECSPSVVYVGGVVTFTIDMWNTGEADALNVVLVDDMPAVVSYIPGTAWYWTTGAADWLPFRNPDSTIPATNSVVWNIGTIRGTDKNPDGSPKYDPFHFKVKFDTLVSMSALPRPYVNFANITWADFVGNTYGPISANATFDVVSVFFDKEADRICAAVGEVVTYEFTLSNPSNVPLYYKLWDEQFKPWDPNDPLWEGWLPPKNIVHITWIQVPELRYTVTIGDDDPLVNFANVSLTDTGNNVEVILHDTWLVDILYPEISIVKWSDLKCAAEGDTVTYWINVSNPGPEEMWFSVYDPLLKPGIPVPVLFSGYLTPYDPDTKSWYDNRSFEYLVPDMPADPSDPFEWELVNEAWVYAHDYQWVAGQPYSGLHMKYAWDDWPIDILHGTDILFDKWSSKECAANGEDVTYWLNVSNPSIDTWMNYEVYDPVIAEALGLDPLLPLLSGRLAPYDPDEVRKDWYSNVSITITPEGIPADPLEWELYNLAWVKAWDDQRDTSPTPKNHEAYADDDWLIDIRHIDVKIAKRSDKTCAAVGEQVRYFITVSNPTDTWLNFTLSDSELGLLWDATSVDIWGHAYWALAPGESITFGGELGYDTAPNNGYVYLAKLNHTVTVNDDDPLKNTATVTVWDDQWIQGDQWARLHIASNTSDEVVVDILHPMIEIVKTATPTSVVVGEWIIYEITVRNPSWDTDMNFTLTDDMFGFIWGPGSFDMWGHAYWYLTPGESVTFGGNISRDIVPNSGYVYIAKLLYQAQDDDIPKIVNNATVDAWDRQMHRVSANDSAEVLVYDYARVFGYVYQDNDLSGGLKGLGDFGLYNWKVTLTGTDMFGNSVSRFTYSDTTGFYHFDEVVPGLYSVAEVLIEHPGWTNTTPTVVPIVLVGGEEERVDFGNIQYGRITGKKWLDDHMNGYQDLAPWPEPGLEGWIIHLDGIQVNGEVVNRTTTTDANGDYAFDNLLPGIYDVWEELPAGWVAPITSWIYEDVEVQSGWEITCCKFGNVKLEDIWGWKFYDWNMNRVKDGEPGIQGWHITLTGWLNDGPFPYQPMGATPVGPITIETDANGVWRFSGLLPGVYIITEEDRDGWYHTTPASISLAIASYYGVGQIKFGNVPLTTITGHKFFDKDMDGVWEPADLYKPEPGLEGWTITLEKEIAPDVWTLVGTTTTDLGGLYEFKDLLPGKYRVTEIVKAGWVNTTTLPVIVIIPAYTISHQLLPQFVYVNIGNMRYSSIEGYKFLDEYGADGAWPNGIRDLGESGLGNWEITLQGWAINGLREDRKTLTRNSGTLLAEIGYYCFGQLLPGTYWVNETLQDGWVPTKTTVNLMVVPAYPWGPAVKMVVDFANMLPERDPEMIFVLEQGWNLWSSPLDVPGMTAMDLLSAIGPTASVVIQLNKSSGEYEAYVAGSPARFNFQIELGQGYAVWSSAEVAFTLHGWYVPSSESSVTYGWNMIGYSGLKATKASAVLNSIEGCNGMVLIYLDSDTGEYMSYVKGNPDRFDFIVTPGRAYVIWVDGTGTVQY